MRSWSFSLALLVGYLLTFQLWRAVPTRTAFLVVGGVAVVAMAWGLKRAARRHYFANRTDLVLHGLVIADVALESISYEAFNTASMCLLCVAGNPGTFHGSYSFCWCAAVLGGLVGGYHWYALGKVRCLNPSAGANHDAAATPGEAAKAEFGQ
jgi:hypothetical protein